MNGPIDAATVANNTVATPSTRLPKYSRRRMLAPISVRSTSRLFPISPFANKKTPDCFVKGPQVTLVLVVGLVTVRPHPRRGAVTLMFPDRSPDFRIIPRITSEERLIHAFPSNLTVAKCESSSRLQWRYRSGFSPLSLSVPTLIVNIRTPRNHTYLVD